MEFGVFQGASVGPRPWDETEPQRIRDDVGMGVEADRAYIDILTDGRIELGTGRGSGSTEVNTFGITNE